MIGQTAVKKSGFTLIELIITIVLAGILITAMICQFVSLIRFNKMVEFVGGQTREAPLAVREARIVLSSLTRVLRFATTVTTDFNANTLTATIEGGHISLIPTPPATRTITYQLSGDGLHFIDTTAGTNVVISKNVKQLVHPSLSSWDPVNKETTLWLIFFDDNGNYPIETKIKALT